MITVTFILSTILLYLLISKGVVFYFKHLDKREKHNKYTLSQSRKKNNKHIYKDANIINIKQAEVEMLDLQDDSDFEEYIKDILISQESLDCEIVNYSKSNEQIDNKYYNNPYCNVIRINRKQLEFVVKPDLQDESDYEEYFKLLCKNKKRDCCQDV